MRAAWGWTLAEQFVQDLRYALRNMVSNKAFTALAILSLALGIGANTAIFSFMDSILLRSLPVDHPERLVILSFWTKENEVHGINLHDDSFLPTRTGTATAYFHTRHSPCSRATTASSPMSSDTRAPAIFILRPEIGQKSPGPNMSRAITFKHWESLRCGTPHYER